MAEYMHAEIAMKEGKKIARKAWPAGKVAYHDVDGDGLPDQLDFADPDFIERSIEIHELFLSNIKIALNGVVQPSDYITQADTLALDWFVYP